MSRLAADRVILCADDFGLSAAVTQGICELAEAERLSALSAMVTFSRWPEDARRLADIRGKVAVGLHLNLTLGHPLGSMPGLAPKGVLPPVGLLVKRAVLGRIDPQEIEAEVRRQLDLFETMTGYPPDHIDGHQHIHALTVVRRGVLNALSARFKHAPKPLVRDPADRMMTIVRRGGERFKAASIALLAAGLGVQARRLGFPTNTGFSGFSAFDPATPYLAEFDTAMDLVGPGHMLMCHPGYWDEELRTLDPVVERRLQELEALRTLPGLPERIWRPSRTSLDAPVDWATEFAAMGSKAKAANHAG